MIKKLYVRSVWAMLILVSQTLNANDVLMRSTEDPISVTPPDHARQVQSVSFDIERFNKLRSGDEFYFDCYGAPFVGTIEKNKFQANGRTLFGSLDGIRDCRFVITTYGQAAAGTFFMPENVGTIRLRYGGPGTHYIHRVDRKKIRTCAEFEPVRKPKESALLQLRDAFDLFPSPRGSSPEGTCAPPETLFDIMIVYSDDARIEAGGTDAIRAESINAAAITETTYQNCDLAIQTNIVWLEEVNYSETGDYEDHLDRLTDPSDGILDSVHLLRDIVDADFVSLFVQDNSFGGLAWCDSDLSTSFSVVRWAQAGDGLTLAHEIGHNIGCAHNPADADCQPYAFANGHNFFVPVLNSTRHTVMAYSVDGSIGIPYYSSPFCEFLFTPTGLVTRNNVGLIETRKSTCEAFQPTRMDIWVDFDTNLFEAGTFFFPFDSVAEGVDRIQDIVVVDIPLLNLKPGTTSETATITKPMIMRACGGSVIIGDN